MIIIIIFNHDDDDVVINNDHDDNDDNDDDDDDDDDPWPSQGVLTWDEQGRLGESNMITVACSWANGPRSWYPDGTPKELINGWLFPQNMMIIGFDPSPYIIL